MNFIEKNIIFDSLSFLNYNFFTTNIYIETFYLNTLKASYVWLIFTYDENILSFLKMLYNVILHLPLLQGRTLSLKLCTKKLSLLS